MKLNRSFKIDPAYDCIVNPCKFSSPNCKPGQGGSHGRHSAEIVLSVYDDIAELVLVVNTGWDTSNTPNLNISTRNVWNLSSWVSIHTSYPIEDALKSSSCNKWKECYSYSLLGSVAGKPRRILVDEGSDACYQWLEENFTELTLVY